MFRNIALGVTAGCAFVLGSAWAQDEQRVEVTGSAVRRINAETALPVQIITRAQIDRTGATSVTELMQNLPFIQGSVATAQAAGGGGGGYADASIHGIGGERTLVLLNGRRMASWAGQTFTGFASGIDLNGIPLAAIERIEVLTDGASAIYGTDAIAGVVNFILRQDLETGAISLNHTMPKGGVGQNTSLSAAKGFGNLARDGYNLMFSLSHDRQRQIMATDRSFAKSGFIPFSRGGQKYAFFNTGVNSAPANYYILDPATGGADRFLGGNGYYNATGSCPEGTIADGGFCQYDFARTIGIVPESERNSVFSSFSKSLAGHHTLRVDMAYSVFSLTSVTAPAPMAAQIRTGSALYDRYMPGGAAPLDGAAFGRGEALYGDDLYAYWRGVDSGGRTADDRTRALHLSASLGGQVAGWEYNAAVTRSQNRWRETYTGGYLMQRELTDAIDSGAVDPFLLPGRQSAAGIAALDGMQYRGLYAAGRSTLTSAEMRASRPLFAMGGGRAQLGVGAEFRRESISYDPSEIAMGITNAIAGEASQKEAYSRSRNIWGVYGELVMPVSRELELTTALRHDRYGDVGSTTNAKVSARYQPSRQWLVRGSAGTGFRSPSLAQVAAGQQFYGLTGGAYNCPQAALAALQAVDPTVSCMPDGSQYNVISSGSKSLEPEKSQQVSLGIRFEPVNWASVGADLWYVRIRNRINQLTESPVMASDAGYLKNFTIFEEPGTNRHLVALYLPTENLGGERYSGIDWDARVAVDTPLGRLVNRLQWSHMFTRKYQREKGGAWFSNLGRYDDGEVRFRDILQLSGTLAQGNWQHTVAVKYRSGYRDADCTAADCGLVRAVNADGTLGAPVDMVGRRVASHTTVHVQTRYVHNKALTLTAGIDNLFDRDPPMTVKLDGGHQMGYDARYYDPRGRTVYVTAQYAF